MKTMAWVALLAAASAAQAANYDEASQGDLSGNGLAPSVLVLQAGSNGVVGHFGRSPVPDVPDLDYLSVLVPEGHVLEQVVLRTLVAGGANSFLGAMAGPQFTMPPSSRDPSPLLGWAHIFSNQAGQDLLPAMAIAGPLQAGRYTFWINETDTSQDWQYAFDLQVSAVPEPGGALLAAAGLLGLAAGRRRRR